MIKILIVDDEKIACENLAKKIRKIRGDVEIKNETDPVHALAKISEWNPQILFLDVQMPELDGFEFLRQISQERRTFALIFCTAYSEHALRAFDEAAVDYLLKPVEPERLKNALERIGSKIQMVDPLSNLREKSYMQKLFVKVKSQPTLIDIADVDYFSSESHETIAIYKGRELFCELSLSTLENQLNPSNFFRCHRSKIVNLKKVVNFDPKTNKLSLQNSNVKIDVSKRSKSLLLQKMKNYAATL